MIATGVRNNSALAFFVRKRGDLVVRPTKFKSADRLLVFGLQKQPAVRVGVIELDQMRARGNSGEDETRRSAARRV